MHIPTKLTEYLSEPKKFQTKFVEKTYKTHILSPLQFFFRKFCCYRHNETIMTFSYISEFVYSA